LIALGVTPVLYALYAIIATIIAVRAKAPLKLKISTPLLVLVALPFMNYAALKFGEAGMDVLKWVLFSESVQADHTNIKLQRSLPPLIVALVPGQQRSLDKLKAMRVDLSNQVASLINDFGPKIYDDFNEVHFLSWIIIDVN